MSIQPALQHIPADLVCVADYERYARQHLPHPVFEYICGGGADEISLRRNRATFDQISIVPRVLRDCTQGGTQTHLLGEAFRHPILLAPVAFQKLAHPQGELASARAASLLEAGMVVSTLASETLENIAAATQAPRWFQLYFQENRDFTVSLVRRAEAAGYTRLVVTVDAPLQGIRNRAQRAGFTLPEHVSAINLSDRPPLPYREFTTDQSIVLQGMMSEAPTWGDIAWLQTQTALPIILKGVLHAEDARLAQSMGIAGIIVSNHGGRVLDSVPSALQMLPAIRRSVGNDYPLLLDGGIQRGTDVFKALALGANAVLVGRPQLYALAVAGALGVAHMLRLLREELEVTMALAGTPTLEDITDQAICKEGGMPISSLA
ncbi:MAG: alpha-hydroxy-acid oxidizing protein [Hahellaceae bacterium]|nr:alpha-hydroxy-acid oxidizing protein [Hahellaceae bacterium]MCP5169807.1 alpha-hydroxy-acid oxidizing protein [Hahellaceae bacterium]